MLPPLVQRELQIALLRRKARRQWMSAAWTAGAITLFFMLVLGVTSNRSTGRTLFRCLFGFAIAGVVTRGFGLTADLFSEERRNGTLGLLVLTGLRPRQIFTSKLLGAGFLAVYALLGGLPFFTIPFLAGGVGAAQYLCAFAFLANALLFCIAVGLLASVLHRDGGQAYLTAQLVTVGLCIGPPLVYWFRSTAPVGLQALSPAYPAYLVFTRYFRGSPPLFWLSSGITLCYSAAALLLAAVFLQRTWRDGPQAIAPTGWRARWRALVRGGERWQCRMRARFLADQPFCWLAARDRSPVVIGYAVLVVAALVWLAGWAGIGPRFLRPANAFISSIVLHQALNLVLAYAAGRRFAEERLSGSFEILLTAPLRAADIVEGQSKALFAQFRLVALIAFIFDLFLCFTGLAALNQKGVGSTAYLCAWALMLVFWFALHLEAASLSMWISAWTARPGYAAMQATKTQLYWWFLVWMLSGGSFVAPFQATSLVSVFSVMMVVLLLLSFGRRRLLRQKLSKELRQIAGAPIPARHDKRFKNWDPNKIFPPGHWGQMVLRPAKSAGRMDTLNG